MAKKEKNTGLGRGLDSLIPKIEETEVEEGISLEDLLRESEDESKTFEELVEEVEEEFDGEDELQVLEKSADVEDEKPKDSSEYTNVFFNDDEKVEDDEIKTEEKISSEKSVENIDSTVNLNEETDASSEIIEASDDIKEVGSLLSEKEEKLIDEVIETVEKNPRITLWSAKSAAVLRYLRKTEPEFSISSEASDLIDAAIAEKYPEIWTLFNHL
ncbi:AAA family ATPase [uncultured Methanobrevibacter sp.]|uniref:AAA family ATPase n=1 Tax=uncultured Methanobrevibacter sp. TaxID=253161 RepID=UPI0025E2280D|nr:AAA family ATPase [uncultured Methanobrevibacter sp.]